MGLQSFYKKVRQKSDIKSLNQVGKATLEKGVKTTLEKYFDSIDNLSTVTVHWMDDNNDSVKTSSRDMEADYSIDINANGIEVDGYGVASVNTLGMFNCILEFYRNSETGRSHDYLMRVNAGGTSDKFINSLVDKVKRAFEKAEED